MALHIPEVELLLLIASLSSSGCSGVGERRREEGGGDCGGNFGAKQGTEGGGDGGGGQGGGGGGASVGRACAKRESTVTST